MHPTTHAITGATALLGHELAPTAGAVIVIRAGRIVAAGTARDVPVPDDAAIVDGSGMTLLPGFIDAHVHIGFYDPSDVLAGGLTTVRDLGWPPDRIDELVAATRSPGYDGPSIVAAGPMLTAPGGYPSRAGWAPPGTAREIKGATDARSAVDEVADRGYCIVKIALNPPVGPVLDPDTLSAIVEAAHARGLKVTGHIHGVEELHKAIAAGVDELAHMLMSDEAIPQSTLEWMVAMGVTIVPTLSVFSGTALRTAIANLRAFREAGGQVIYGTDLGNEGPKPGLDPSEVRGMSEAGMDGRDIVRSATVDSSAWLGLDHTGVIAPGRVADLVLVGGDPLGDPMALTRIVAVWREGVTKGS